MNAEINIPQELVEQIADRVIEQLKTLKHLFSASNKQENSTIFDVKELAEYLRVEENWIYTRTRKQEIPFIKKGKYCLFRKSAIDTWLNQDAVKPLSSFAIPKKNTLRHSDC